MTWAEIEEIQQTLVESVDFATRVTQPLNITLTLTALTASSAHVYYLAS